MVLFLTLKLVRTIVGAVLNFAVPLAVLAAALYVGDAVGLINLSQLVGGIIDQLVPSWSDLIGVITR